MTILDAHQPNLYQPWTLRLEASLDYSEQGLRKQCSKK
jgi:hypothetical protein